MRNFLVEKKLWLSLLSCEFEEFCTNNVDYDTLSKKEVTKMKRHITKVVKKYIPAGNFIAIPSRPR
jgi:hypothetical protein